MNVPIHPMDDYVVAVSEEPETKTASGILLTAAAKEKPQFAKVVAVGGDVDDVKVGDKILYKNEYEAVHAKIDGQDYAVIYYKNIIATVK